MSVTTDPRTQPSRGAFAAVNRQDRRLGLLTLVASVAAALTRPLGHVVAFVVAAVALALLAACVGRAVDALGERVSPAATGILQSALGNLPELLILVFALRAGLTTVVQATIVGSILANVTLVLGLAFVVGGLKHGQQHFPGSAARDIGSSLLLAVLALSVPSLTSLLHSPAAGHERTLSVFVSIVLLAALVLSLISTLRASTPRVKGPGHGPVASAGDTQPTVAAAPHAERAAEPKAGGWPLWLAIAVLAATGVLAAVVSDWFVSALEPAMEALHISDAFAGLVVVAIAGNAVENFVGVQLALKNQAESALQVVLQSPLQIAMLVAPVVLLVSPLLGAPAFTLVLPPLLLASLLAAALLATFITLDGESTWYEGAVLIALYALLAASFWWG